MRDPFRPVGAWRTAVAGVRGLAAAALAFAVGWAVLDQVAPAAVPWWAGGRSAVVVLAVAALATAAPAANQASPR